MLFCLSTLWGKYDNSFVKCITRVRTELAAETVCTHETWWRIIFTCDLLVCILDSRHCLLACFICPMLWSRQKICYFFIFCVIMWTHRKQPDQTWVQCDDCLKWRKLPDGIDPKMLPKKWFCHMNSDPQFRCACVCVSLPACVCMCVYQLMWVSNSLRSCFVEEEPEVSDDELLKYQKTYKMEWGMNEWISSLFF